MMFFNPLFLQVTNSGQAASQLKMQQMSGSSYLFSDIIKVCFDKVDNNQDGAGSQDSVPVNPITLTDFVEKLFMDKIKTSQVTEVSDLSISGDLENLINKSPVHLNKKAVHQLVTDLIIGSSEFKGRISLVLDQSQLPDKNGTFEDFKESPETLINVLKNGGTLLIEDPNLEKDNGLLITIVESTDDTEISPREEVKGKDDFKIGNSLIIEDQPPVSESDYGIKLSLINLKNGEFSLVNPNKDADQGIKLNIPLNSPREEYVSVNSALSEIPVFIKTAGNKYRPAAKLEDFIGDNNTIKLDQPSGSMTVSEVPAKIDSLNNNVGSDTKQFIADSNSTPAPVSDSSEPIQKPISSFGASALNVQNVNKQVPEGKEINQTESQKTEPFLISKTTIKTADAANNIKHVVSNMESDAGKKTDLKVSGQTNLTVSDEPDKIKGSLKNISTSPELKKHEVKDKNIPGIENTSKTSLSDSSSTGKTIRTNTSSFSSIRIGKQEITNGAKDKSGDVFISNKKISAPKKDAQINADQETSKEIKNKNIDENIITKSLSKEKMNFTEQIKLQDDKAVLVDEEYIIRGKNENFLKTEIFPEPKITQSESPNNNSVQTKVKLKVQGMNDDEESVIINTKVVKEELKTPVAAAENQKPVSMKDVISKGIKEINSGSPVFANKEENQISGEEIVTGPKDDYSKANDKNVTIDAGSHRISNANKIQNSNNTSSQNENKESDQHTSGTLNSEKKDPQGFAKELTGDIPVNNRPTPQVENELSHPDTANGSAKEKVKSSDKSFTSENEITNVKRNHTETILRPEAQGVTKEKLASEPLIQTAKIIKVAEIAKEVSKFIQDGNKNSIVLKLDPENLGNMKIQLDVVNKMINAHIEVDNESTRKLVESHLPQIYNTLSQNGVQLNMLNISLNNFDQKNTKNLFSRKRTSGVENEEITDDKSIIQEKNMGYNTYEYLI